MYNFNCVFVYTSAIKKYTDNNRKTVFKKCNSQPRLQHHYF